MALPPSARAATIPVTGTIGCCGVCAYERLMPAGHGNGRSAICRTGFEPGISSPRATSTSAGWGGEGAGRLAAR